jgi:hypothetical protein
MNIIDRSDVGKRCPHCTGLIGYQHDVWCPRDEKFAQRDQYIDDSARYSLARAKDDLRFYRGSAPAHQLFAQSQARVEAYRARPLEQRFDDMLTYEDRQLLSGMKIALN